MFCRCASTATVCRNCVGRLRRCLGSVKLRARACTRNRSLLSIWTQDQNQAPDARAWQSFTGPKRTTANKLRTANGADEQVVPERLDRTSASRETQKLSRSTKAASHKMVVRVQVQVSPACRSAAPLFGDTNTRGAGNGLIDG